MFIDSPPFRSLWDHAKGVGGALSGSGSNLRIEFTGSRVRKKLSQIMSKNGKWVQITNLDKLGISPSLPACHEVCVLSFPVPIDHMNAHVK